MMLRLPHHANPFEASASRARWAAEKEQQDSGDWLAHPRGQGLQPSAEPLQAVGRRREYPPSNPDDRNRKEAHTEPAETFNRDTSP